MLKLLCKMGLGGNMANVMAGPRPRSEELMKKKLTTLALVLFAALSMLALCACNSGPSSEEVIREGLSEEFDMIVNKRGWRRWLVCINETARTNYTKTMETI